jgi:hypothetical protein
VLPNIDDDLRAGAIIEDDRIRFRRLPLKRD